MIRGSTQAIVLLTIAFCASCGGSSPTPEPVLFEPALPAEYARSEAPASFEWDGAESAADRAEEIAAWLTDQGAAASTAEYLGGVHIVEASWDVPESRQIFFINDQEWTGSIVAAVLRDHYAVRAEDGAPVAVSFVGPNAWAFPLDYLYGDNWWGPLEAELYWAFANPDLDPATPEPFIEAAKEVLERFGLSMRGNRFTTLDTLLAALPRPENLGTTYQPVATLVAIGLMMGDSLESRYDRVEWVAGAELMARYFGLRIDGDEGLRPIDFVMEAYRTSLSRPIEGYAELVSLRATIE